MLSSVGFGALSAREGEGKINEKVPFLLQTRCLDFVELKMRKLYVTLIYGCIES